MWQGMLVCLSLLGADEVSVKPLHGEAVRGSLISLTEKSVVIRTATGELKWEATAVQSLKPALAGQQPTREGKLSPAVLVELNDNSLLVGSRASLTAGVAALELPDGPSLEVPHKVIRSLRFRRQDEELQKQWNTIVAANSSGDQLVVRKAVAGAAAAGSVVLDQLEGLVHGVTSKGVAFEFDGDRMDVPLEKVEGIIFHQRQTDSGPEPLCRVRDVHGGEWHVQALQVANGRVNLQTVSGVRGELGWDRVLEVDFTAGNLVYLSDMKIESLEWRPFLVTAATPPALSKWFGLRRDQTMNGSVMILGGQSFEKGLALHSRSTVSFRLTKEFQHFQAVVGIDERFRGTADLKLTISGDERVLLDKEVRGSDPPLEIDLDIRGVRRLKILVDFGEDRSDAGDHLLLGNARLTK